MKPHPLKSFPLLSKEEINELPIRRYQGKIRLINSDNKIKNAVNQLSRDKIVGVDTETKPTFRKGEYHLPCLIQVAAASVVYLFQLKRLEDFSPLADFLENSKIVKAGIGLKGDFEELKNVFPFSPENAVDLSLVAQREGIKRSSVRSLAAQFLDIRIPKGTSTSNWARAELTEKQITYAATDAWICRELFLKFRKLGFIDKHGKPRIKSDQYPKGISPEAQSSVISDQKKPGDI